MNTLMSRQTFDRLVDVQRELATDSIVANGKPMAVFVPWAGDRIKSSPCIYYIGAGLAAEEQKVSDLNYETSLSGTVSFIESGMESRRYTPFWLFLNGLSEALFRAPSQETSARWGWSNLLKIGWSRGSPNRWPGRLKELQRETGQMALNEELNKLSNSLIVIVSALEFGVLWPVVGKESQWNTDYADDGVYWLQDAGSSNLYIHGYHPGSARRQRIYDIQLRRTITLARDLLSPF